LSVEPAIDITPRNIDFTLDAARINDWLGGSREATAFWNALSLTFPVGERFFVTSVNHYRNEVTEPKLAAEVKAFVRQEAYHTREHIAYNEALATVVDVADLERRQDAFSSAKRERYGPLAALAATAAAEHLTAILAHGVLNHAEYLRGARPDYERLWRWHALEEMEHKAVSFDVMVTVTAGNHRAQKNISMMYVTYDFARVAGYRVWHLFKAQGMHRSPRSWARLAWHLLVYPGFLRRLIPTYVCYYASKFHPSDIDDTQTIARVRNEFAAYGV